MPPAQGESSRSVPRPSPSISCAASSKETSVKTDIERSGAGSRRSKRQDLPDALAGGAARAVAAIGGELARAVADDDVVARRAVLRMDRRLDELAAHAQLHDHRPAVVDEGALDHRL